MSRAARLRTTLFLAVALVAVGVSAALYAGEALRDLELDTVDARFSVRGSEGPPPEVVFVRIDDVTFDELPPEVARFPFPRSVHARVIDELAAAGARVIAYDVQFTEESDDPDADTALIEAVRAAGNVVLATTEVAEDGSTRVFGGGEGLEYSRGIAANSNYPNDPGRVIRRMAYSIDGLRSFPVVAAEQALGRPMDESAFDEGTAWIDFAGGPGTVRNVSLSTVYAGDAPPETFRDKVVVVGASAPSLQDLHPTSTTGDEPMAGPEIHANSIVTAMNGLPLDDAPGWLDVALIALLGLAAPVASLRLRPLFALAGALALGLAYAVVAQVAFQAGTILPVVYPLGALALAAVGSLAVHYVTTAFERERVRDLFSRFVPENVVDDVLARADGVRLGGRQQEGTVMFSDLRGFTSFAESRGPDEVIDVLNRYLTEMSDAILDHGGTLVAYMGDGIMAVFGAPIQQPDHADRGLAAARRMLERLDAFNAWMRENGLGDGFKMGIGLNSGQVMSGNVGSERRLEYTAIGDTTNTASRIEGMTKGTPYQLFVADSTYRLLSAPPADLVDTGEHAIRGREHGIRLWALAEDGAPAPGEGVAAAAPPPAETAS